MIFTMVKKKKIQVLKPILIVTIAVIVLLFILQKSLSIFPQKTGGLKGLIFQSKNDEQRMQTLDKCIQDFSKTGWQNHTDYIELGNFYQSKWCNGAACGNGNRDMHSITLFTTEYKLPQVYGIGLDVALIPDKPGWGVNFSFANGMAESVTNDRLQINFLKYDDSEGIETEKVYLGSRDSYKVFETEISINSPSSLENDLVSYTTSATSMRDNALAQLKNFRNKVSSEITSNNVMRCEYKPSERAGIPPICVKERSLTENEKSDELKKANEYFNSQENLLSADYQEMYNVLIKAVPLKNCLY